RRRHPQRNVGRADPRLRRAHGGILQSAGPGALLRRLPADRQRQGGATGAHAGHRPGTECNHMTPQPQAHLPRPVHHEPPAHAPNAALLIDFDNLTRAIRSDLQTELKRLLLSGDSDFSALVLKLKEHGKCVIGVGIRESSSDLLIQNCDEYYTYNELAGFTKESDVTYVRRDPWELVIEAVKQMTAHNDVMRSDRLKQVMQEIDPTFDEKDAGFSRFSKFVVEAAHKGLINLNKLDNGQYEIALGAGV